MQKVKNESTGYTKNSLSYFKEMLYKKYFSMRNTISFIKAIVYKINSSDPKI